MDCLRWVVRIVSKSQNPMFGLGLESPSLELDTLGFYVWTQSGIGDFGADDLDEMHGAGLGPK